MIFYFYATDFSTIFPIAGSAGLAAIGRPTRTAIEEGAQHIEEMGARSGVEDCAFVVFNRELDEWMEERREEL